jgi:hypothetical protein
MSMSVSSPRIRCHKATDGTWTATLYIEGRFHAQAAGFGSQAEARGFIRSKYL